MCGLAAARGKCGIVSELLQLLRRDSGNAISCHPGGGQCPVQKWIPAFAGMTSTVVRDTTPLSTRIAPDRVDRDEAFLVDLSSLSARCTHFLHARNGLFRLKASGGMPRSTSFQVTGAAIGKPFFARGEYAPTAVLPRPLRK